MLLFLRKNSVVWYLSNGRKWVGKEKIPLRTSGIHQFYFYLFIISWVMFVWKILWLLFCLFFHFSMYSSTFCFSGEVDLFRWRTCYILLGIFRYVTSPPSPYRKKEWRRKKKRTKKQKTKIKLSLIKWVLTVASVSLPKDSVILLLVVYDMDGYSYSKTTLTSRRQISFFVRWCIIIVPY